MAGEQIPQEQGVNMNPLNGETPNADTLGVPKKLSTGLRQFYPSFAPRVKAFLVDIGAKSHPSAYFIVIFFIRLLGLRGA
jgi:hypothetical protein